jgi:D-alanyl-D-alanine carboxypeptidase
VEDANRIFAGLLNEKARELGADSTNFDNSFGFHSANHFTTAYDMAIITRAFMDNAVLARISGTRVYEDWTSTNLMLPLATFGHSYVIGGKAGFTTPAGHVFAGAAEHNGLQIVTVVMGGTNETRWLDTRRLMDYAFSNFRFREIARAGEIVATAEIENSRLGDSNYLDIISTEGFTALLHDAEYEAITRSFDFDPLLYVPQFDDLVERSESPQFAVFLAPIDYGAAVGTVVYSLNGNTLFEAPIIAASTVYPRNFDSDMDYYLALFFGNIFTTRALPYWFGIFGTIFGIVGVTLAITADRRAERKRSTRYTRF